MTLKHQTTKFSEAWVTFTFIYVTSLPVGWDHSPLTRCSFTQDSIRVSWDARCGHGCYSCKNNKWPVPVTAHRRIQKNPKDYVTKGSMYHIALSVYIKQDQFPKTTNLCLDTPQFDPPICMCTISDVLVSPLRIDYNNIIIQIIINVNAICQL